MSTYHSVEDGWYLRLPDLLGRIRSSLPARPGRREVTVTFSTGGQRGATTRITKLTGSGRGQSHPGGRVILRRLPESSHGRASGRKWELEYGLTEDEVREAFSPDHHGVVRRRQLTEKKGRYAE